MSPPEFGGSSKRESFIETGFLETLKPQFTPGQSLTTPSSSSQAFTAEDKLNALHQQQENDELRSKMRDLTEKLDTLKQRRTEDKERLREFDKMKLQYDQLQEFKTKIMDAQSHLQRELQRSRQETKDAIDAKNQYVDEMSELAENVEMITLDKEMAEEKADTLQLELEAAKERSEELQLDLDILKAEMQNKSGAGGGLTATGVTIDSTASFEFKQLEKQNVRLRETLVRLRDLSAHEKHEIQKLTKELDTKKSEVAELQRTKEKLSSKVCGESISILIFPNSCYPTYIILFISSNFCWRDCHFLSSLPYFHFSDLQSLFGQISIFLNSLFLEFSSARFSFTDSLFSRINVAPIHIFRISYQLDSDFS